MVFYVEATMTFLPISCPNFDQKSERRRNTREIRRTRTTQGAPKMVWPVSSLRHHSFSPKLARNNNTLGDVPTSLPGPLV